MSKRHDSSVPCSDLHRTSALEEQGPAAQACLLSVFSSFVPCLSTSTMSVAINHGNAPTTHTAELPLRVRRAAVACTSCRRRKIRCDVTVHGSPCTNCRLDNDRCVIINLRRPRKVKNPERPQPTRLLQDALPPRLSISSLHSPVYPISATTSLTEILGDTSDLGVYPSHLSAGLNRLSAHDVAYLESRKALVLPKQATIHTLLRSYFLHIHPCFPIVKESEFRESTRRQTPFSLLVFQAMLFAAACVSAPCVRG
jgi:hypothetical protein